jgi:hypothetical protein
MTAAPCSTPARPTTRGRCCGSRSAAASGPAWSMAPPARPKCWRVVRTGSRSGSPPTGPPVGAGPDVLVVAVPRPKVLARVLRLAAELGVGALHLCRSWRVDPALPGQPRADAGGDRPSARARRRAGWLDPAATGHRPPALHADDRRRRGGGRTAPGGPPGGAPRRRRRARPRAGRRERADRRRWRSGPRGDGSRASWTPSRPPGSRRRRSGRPCSRSRPRSPPAWRRSVCCAGWSIIGLRDFKRLSSVPAGLPDRRPTQPGRTRA